MGFWKRVSAIVFTVVLISSLTICALASDGNVIYNDDAGQFFFAPGSEYSLTDLFTEFKDVMPGDSLTQRILIRNDASDKVKIKIYMRSLGAHPDSEAFLSQLTLRVEKVTDTVMFDAAASETAQLTDWVCLGTLYSGGEVELDVTLEVPVSLGNEFKQAIGYLDWEFMVEELPVEESDPDLPSTGDTFPMGGHLALLTGSALLLLLLCRKRQKKQA